MATLQAFEELGVVGLTDDKRRVSRHRAADVRDGGTESGVRS